ncbi:5-methyltetrahydropteroyltriglutamate--homocysteine S-methyltransferase [Hydrogenovibrio marinus]|uniref:5-methyltetrahydropteroyltriglutamate--homocysteine methyltransferase n=1 Tax=Hydrogenovibrio marinus TaxID=28885 RepID=A0A066ZVH9_HYDMR|nr:5-methyltetrahydropteroyltriglutamate--homocysteine S-methyltransferase [Hydrogenovibrio marinus]KDN96264.1 5-methyltetrahydropteroyltriglutamate--homocysteine methyltransferase [Hydrogenovibrio marinus]BBN60553.1 5-methyltetrahydropteroyltriglutamate--homocysteine methyltransferase [Hydrogenovibrio marinus]
MALHNLGYPRIGDFRELKFTLEAYWKGEKSLQELEAQAREIRYQNFQTQIKAGVELIPVNDFAYYDQVLNMSTLLGVIPKRFRQENFDVEVAFRMARGRAPSDDGHGCCAGHGHDTCESKADYAGAMKKWFDTNYHYIVPELEDDTEFTITDTRLFDEVAEALVLKQDASNIDFKPVLVGPVTYLYLAENKGTEIPKLSRLPALLEVYAQILQRLATQGVEWVQIDEPILVLELEAEWQNAFKEAYQTLAQSPAKLLLATYFETLGDNLGLACQLPVAGLHYDGLRGAKQLDEVIEQYPAGKVLSIGLVDGRNIWKADINDAIEQLQEAKAKFGDNLWIAPSCSLLHVPVNLEVETKLNPELKNYLSFAKQKLGEIKLLNDALHDKADKKSLEDNRQVLAAKANSKLIHNEQVQARLAKLDDIPLTRDEPYAVRAILQVARFDLPLFPTTTIGSFPQTQEIRQARRRFKNGEIDELEYIEAMQAEIRDVCERQERIGIDVFVHGEPERNDMVEYFGEQLDGYAFTQFGWVQSYGSRCVKPPIIFGDVSRPLPMTVNWSTYAQSQTDKIMKGMLTGAVTMLQWSFVRNDQTRETTCNQIALALRDEVLDLEAAGIHMIQIDEAALREGLPLKKSDWDDYLYWAVNSFRLTTSGVQNDTQIHTHMCYSEFNDIIQAVAKMDADVITIETSKSQMKLLDAFVDFQYPNEIGPGVYDIHSPNIPTVEQMVDLIQKAAKNIPVERLWVNPDCGLKTRGWKETEPALVNMVEAAKILKKQFEEKIQSA